VAGVPARGEEKTEPTVNTDKSTLLLPVFIGWAARLKLGKSLPGKSHGFR
jgi:hypothetical protein